MSITFILILIASFLVMVASLVGILFISRFLKNWVSGNLKYLIAFASGVFLVVTYGMTKEAIEFSHSSNIVAVALTIGFLTFYFFEKTYPEIHCHHDDHLCLSRQNKKSATRILIGDSFHNVGDGILLSSVFVLDIRLGLLATVGILVHELVQEISEYFVYKDSGYSNVKALSLNFISASSILIGSIGGYYLASFDFLIGPLVGFASGIFIYMLLTDLIPNSVRNSILDKKYFYYLMWSLFGVLLVIVLQKVTSSFLERQGLDSHGHIYSGKESDHNE